MRIESLARALQGDLTYSPEEVKALDRLTAMALGSVVPTAGEAALGAELIAKNDLASEVVSRTARESLLNSLGMSLLAFKHAMRPDEFGRAQGRLRDCMGWRLKNIKKRARGHLAKAAIKEWVIDVCPGCCGAGHVFDRNGVATPCLSCGGSLKRRYSDDDRAAELQLGSGAAVSFPMSVAHFFISLSVGIAIQQQAKRFKAG